MSLRNLWYFFPFYSNQWKLSWRLNINENDQKFIQHEWMLNISWINKFDNFYIWLCVKHKRILEEFLIFLKGTNKMHDFSTTIHGIVNSMHYFIKYFHKGNSIILNFICYWIEFIWNIEFMKLLIQFPFMRSLISILGWRSESVTIFANRSEL